MKFKQSAGALDAHWVSIGYPECYYVVFYDPLYFSHTSQLLTQVVHSLRLSLSLYIFYEEALKMITNTLTSKSSHLTSKIFLLTHLLT